jgi:probable HAF family extracellular repeat protein
MKRLRGLGLVAVTIVAVVAGTAAPAAASEQLRPVDLGTLAGGCCSQAIAINDRGDVVGDSDVRPGPARHAFLWHRGKMTDLGTLGGRNSTATDVNNRGDVVGAGDRRDGSTHAVLWRHGRKIDLGTLGGRFSSATAINDAGQVVGFSQTAAGTLHAFSWRPGRMTDLGLLKGGFARAYDINNRGQIAGESSVDGMNSVPVRWQHRSVTSLTTRFGQASAINDRGQIAGFFFGGGSFLWSQGRITDLGTPPGATVVEAFGINNRGQVVGHTDFDAFLWQRDRMTLLPRLTGSTSAAYDINNRGQIVGSSATTPDGLNHHAVVWTR